MSKNDIKYERLKSSYRALEKRSKQTANDVERLSCDFRAAALALVEISRDGQQALLVTRISALCGRIQAADARVSGVIARQGFDVRNFPSSCSKSAQTSLLQPQVSKICVQTADSASQTDDYLAWPLIMAGEQIQQPELALQHYREGADIREKRLREQLIASQNSALSFEEAFRQISTRFTQALTGLTRNDIEQKAIRAYERIQRISASLTAFRHRQSGRCAATASAAFEAIHAIQGSLKQLEGGLQPKLANLRTRIAACTAAVDGLHQKQADLLHQSRTLESQRDDCVDELTALCSAVKTQAQREEQLRHQLDTSSAAAQERIIQLVNQVQEQRDEIQDLHMLLDEVARLLGCNVSGVPQSVAELVSFVTSGGVKSEADDVKQIGHKSVKCVGTEDQIERQKECNTSQILAQNQIIQQNEDILLQFSEAKTQLLTAEMEKQRSAAQIADMQRTNADLQLRLATLSAQLENCGMELQMSNSQLQTFEQERLIISQQLEKRQILVNSTNITGALEACFSRQDEALAGASQRFARLFGAIRGEIALLKEGFSIYNINILESLDINQETHLRLEFAYERRVNHLQAAVGKERRYSAGMISFLTGLYAQLGAADLGTLEAIGAAAQRVSLGLQRVQTSFIELTKRVVEISTERQILRSDG